MDTKIKKVCPNCNQLYYLKSILTPKVGNLPLFLSCGHSMCESCITNILKFEEPIECKVCHQDMKLAPGDLNSINQKKAKLYQYFPVNFTMLGELALQLMEGSEVQEKQESTHFIDLQAIIANKDDTKGKCMECHNQTTKMCQQCATVLCDTCFTKSHKNFIIFKTHVLVNIDQVLNTPNNCKVHKGKPLDYYCKDCNKSVCMDCLVVGGDKSCKNHNVVSMQEVNDNFLEELIDVAPKVDETFRRLTKTAVDVGNLLHNIENETGSSSELTNMLADIKQHFSKLGAAIQKHEQEVVNIIVKLKCSEKDSLHKAKNDLETMLKKAKNILNSINIAADPNKVKKVNLNLSTLLNEAKQIAEFPWYLTRDESNEPLKVAVNDDLCSLVCDYIHLEGNANSVYKLRATSELKEGMEIPPPPPAPVFPPELPKDVRLLEKVEKRSNKNQTPMFCKNVPKYRAKSGSVSSLNSLHSDTSDKGFTQYTVYGDHYQRPAVQQVQPFAESQHPKQLHEGSQELIYISHIVDPHNFFVQRACHQSLVKEMLREFRNASSMPKPSLNHVTEGKIYLMFNKADNMWQRCRVISINRKDPKSPSFFVFCIDFGSTETVTIDKLRLLPPARVQSPYPLATNCSLANCEPKNGTWTSDDAYLIQNIVDNKQAIIHVRHIRSTANYSVTLECDVTTFDEDVSVAHALVFHDRARMTNPRLPYPRIPGATEKPKIFMSHNDLKPKTVEEVYITYIVSPDKFFVRKRHLMNVFEKISEDLEQEYSLNSNIGLVYQPEIGMSCVVHAEASGGGGWFRGVVTALPGRGRVTVCLADCGEAALVHWTKLRHIHHKYTTTNALASECHLAGVTPLNKKWSAGSVSLLRRFEDKVLELHVEDHRRGSAGVTLFDKTEEDNIICVNTEMIKHKFAVTFGLFMFNRNSDVHNQVYPNKTPLEAPKPRAHPADHLQVLQHKPVTKINEKELDAKDKGPLRLEAKILHYSSPSLLYVSLIHQQKAFNELYEQIQKHYSEKKIQGKDGWEVGDRCCTVCHQSQTWRRAAIIELQGENAKVFYSDFACVETVPISTLRELSPEFKGIGDAAIKCHLCGIVPADGSDEWPTITKEYLKELLDVYQRLFITKLGNFKNKSMPVEVWVYHTIQGDALEPNSSEWRCLNKKIIEQGLGIPDKTQQMSADTEGKKDDMLSFLKNVTGSVNEWLLLEPLPTKPMPSCSKTEDKASNANDVLDDDDVDKPNDDEQSLDTVFITDWLPPEPLPCKEFTGMPTYIDNDGIIYLHDVTQQDTLDLIRKALDVRFKSPDPKAKYAKWSVGEPCIALFFLDNRFYRGRVIEVNNENSNCIIHYVDYGNEETCSFENLRKSVALYQLPIQAHKCVLSKIRPTGAQWDRQTLDYLHKSIVEKQCFVKVTGEPIGDIIPIELKYDKLWINDHLVDFEMAVYSNGSKAVVRKFMPNEKKKREKEPVVVDHDSSGPDYIVGDDNDTINTVSPNSFRSLEGKDWNEIIEMEENYSTEGRFIEYPKNKQTEFMCNISIISDARTLELSIIHDNETNKLYGEMFEEVQRHGGNLAPLNGIFERKACVALFPEDGLWYRAAIMQFSESESRIKVRYVDYGNIEIISLADVREIPKELTDLPPGTIKAGLSGVIVNPDIETEVFSHEYAETFLDKGPFRAKVVNYENSIPYVELRNQDDQLVYEGLIKNGLLLKVND